ncbi:unnamed protein product [Cutaneotrichosporon oleaginosum]
MSEQWRAQEHSFSGTTELTPLCRVPCLARCNHHRSTSPRRHRPRARSRGNTQRPSSKGMRWLRRRGGRNAELHTHSLPLRIAAQSRAHLIHLLPSSSLNFLASTDAFSSSPGITEPITMSRAVPNPPAPTVTASPAPSRPDRAMSPEPPEFSCGGPCITWCLRHHLGWVAHWILRAHLEWVFWRAHRRRRRMRQRPPLEHIDTHEALERLHAEVAARV